LILELDEGAKGESEASRQRSEIGSLQREGRLQADGGMTGGVKLKPEKKAEGWAALMVMTVAKILRRKSGGTNGQEERKKRRGGRQEAPIVIASWVCL
jgi:hypothetical protein